MTLRRLALPCLSLAFLAPPQARADDPSVSLQSSSSLSSLDAARAATRAGRELPIVIDADAIGLVGDPERLHGHDTILTPHEGEFRKLFGEIAGSKPERAMEAARRSQSVIVYKGPDTLVAAPDGRLGFAPPAPAWLASAGTGDVLAGMIAAFLAGGMPAFEAAAAGAWVHGEAAFRCGSGLIAEDLASRIPDALAAARGAT